jgi:hypothetical protein
MFAVLLYISATDVVTVYVFQEPSLLSSLQDNGLTDVVLHALLIKDVKYFKSYHLVIVTCSYSYRLV